MAKPTLEPFSKATACEACPVGQHGSDVDDDITSCTACANQANCAVSTANTCSTTASYTTKTICTSVTDSGYYLDGQVVKPCLNHAVGTTCFQPSSASLCSSGTYDGNHVQNPLPTGATNTFTCDQVLTAKTGFSSSFSRFNPCLLYTSPSPRDQRGSRMPSSA